MVKSVVKQTNKDKEDLQKRCQDSYILGYIHKPESSNTINPSIWTPYSL